MTGLNGKVAVISGGSRGIGFATAGAFLARGALVAVCAHDPERLRAAEARLRAQGEVMAVAVDVRDAGQVRDFVRAVEARFGRIDVLVNNAGVVSVGEFAEEDYASMDAVVDVNVKGVLYLTRVALPGMLRRGEGVIVNVSSGAGLSGYPDLVSYCASKFAVVGFTESLDKETRDRGVRVYAVCPGAVATDMQMQYSGRKIGIPPEQVAERIVRIAAEQPSSKTGRCVVIP